MRAGSRRSSSKRPFCTAGSHRHDGRGKRSGGAAGRIAPFLGVLQERLKAAADLGRRVTDQGPEPDDAVRSMMKTTRLGSSFHCLKAGAWLAGVRGEACGPGGEELLHVDEVGFGAHTVPNTRICSSSTGPHRRAHAEEGVEKHTTWLSVPEGLVERDGVHVNRRGSSCRSPHWRWSWRPAWGSRRLASPGRPRRGSP